MHNEAPTQTIMLYAGPSDGGTITIEATALTVAVRHEGPGSPAHYRRSVEWTIHFQRAVFVPVGFPGHPGKQTATA